MKRGLYENIDFEAIPLEAANILYGSYNGGEYCIITFFLYTEPIRIKDRSLRGNYSKDQ